MEDTKDLLENLDKIHTTAMGLERIRKNLNPGDADLVEYCKNIIMNRRCRIYRRGKNWYCEADGIRITVNAHSYTVITAHRIQSALDGAR